MFTYLHQGVEGIAMILIGRRKRKILWTLIHTALLQLVSTASCLCHFTSRNNIIDHCACCIYLVTCQFYRSCDDWKFILSFQGLKTAIIEGDVIGGTCVNRGCVPSKALLAVSGRMRELKNEHHLKALGIQVIPFIMLNVSA